MIRIIILLSCVALSFLCEAQNLRWGNEFNSNLRSPTLGQLLAGSINNKVYVIENAVKTGQANTTEKDMITSLKIFDGATKFLKEVSLSDILAKQIKAIPEKKYVGCSKPF